MNRTFLDFLKHRLINPDRPIVPTTKADAWHMALKEGSNLAHFLADRSDQELQEHPKLSADTRLMMKGKSQLYRAIGGLASSFIIEEPFKCPKDEHDDELYRDRDSRARKPRPKTRKPIPRPPRR